VFAVGLLGLFFNKTVLKVLLLGAVAFLLLRLLAWFLSFATQLSWVPLVGLIAVTLIVLKIVAVRSSRLGIVLRSVMFLLFAFLTFVLILEILVPVQIPYPLSVPIKLALASLPSLSYFLASRNNSLSVRRISLFHGKLRHHRRISLRNLLPKGIEEGHIVFNAGSRGFRVLKFIEVKQRFNGKENSNTSEQIRRQIAVTFTRQLNILRKLGIEVSYELHCRSGVPRTFIASTYEGRDYRRCRSIVDESSSLLSRSMRSLGSTTISTDSIEDCNKANKILMVPTFANFEEIKQIKNADYNINLFKNRDQNKPTRLRIIHLGNIRSLCLNSKSGLFNELTDIALAHRPIMDFTCILHINLLPETSTDQELMKMSKNHATALTQVSEELKNEFLVESGQARKSLKDHRSGISNARQEARNTDLEIERLQRAKESGYFQVNVTIISEPATVESIATKIRKKAPEDRCLAEMSINRVSPQLLVETIRRCPLLSSDKLTGEEIVSLVQLPKSLSQRQTDLIAAEETKAALTQLPIDIVSAPAKSKPR
jgi:hypothetical protein